MVDKTIIIIYYSLLIHIVNSNILSTRNLRKFRMFPKLRLPNQCYNLIQYGLKKQKNSYQTKRSCEFFYDVINDEKQASEWLKEINSKLEEFGKFSDIWFATDTEYEVYNNHKSNFDNTRMGLIQFYNGQLMDRPILFQTIDNDVKTNTNIMPILHKFLSNPNIHKLFHCYGNDYPVIMNFMKEYQSQFQLSGFAGDTFHMARLLNANVESDSLKNLSMLYNPNGSIKFDHEIMDDDFDFNPSETIEHLRTPQTMKYAARDVTVTYELGMQLKEKLMEQQCEYLQFENPIKSNLWQVYKETWRPFGQLLVEIESEGFTINRQYLKHQKENAEKECENNINKFLQWAEQQTKGVKYMNVSSKPQLAHFFLVEIE